MGVKAAGGLRWRPERETEGLGGGLRSKSFRRFFLRGVEEVSMGGGLEEGGGRGEEEGEVGLSTMT